MPDPQSLRVARELAFATLGANIGQPSIRIEPWVNERLVSIAREGDCAAQETLFSKGDPSDSFFFARQGRVMLTGDVRGPHEVEGPCVFGMFDILLDRPRAGSAFALTPVKYLRVRSDAWFDLLEDSFALARASVMAMVRAVAALEEKAWAARPPPAPPTASHPPGVAAAPMSILERLGVLVDMPLFRGAGVQVLSDLASISEEASFAPGDALLGRGTSRDRFVIAVSGEVEASRDDPRGTWRGGPGQLVCDLAWLADADRKWHARAVTAVRALVFRVEDWFDLMEENFEMVRPTLAALAEQRQELLRTLASSGVT